MGAPEAEPVPGSGAPNANGWPSWPESEAWPAHPSATPATPGAPPAQGTALAHGGPGPQGPPLPYAPPPHTGAWPQSAPFGAGPAHPGRAWPGHGGAAQPEDRRPGAVKRAWQRFVGVLAAIGAFVAKFGALLLKLKYLTLIASMLVSIAAYTLLWGWTFAVGFVLLILVHEMGHVIVLKRQGVRSSLPLFIPFMGAFVSMQESPRSAYEEAQSGLAGPAFGTAAAVAVAVWGNAIGSNFLLRLAFVGFFLNLFNLLPALPLDGGRAAAALNPVLWLAGLVALLVFEVVDPSPVVPILLILGGYELWQRWRRRGSRASQIYFSLSPGQRATIATLYVVIVVVALVGFHATYVSRTI